MNSYVSEADLESNLVNQLAMLPQTVAQLRQHGVTGDTALRLNFFFYTNSESNAANLASVLKQRGYDVETGESAADDGTFLVAGWTTPIKMDEATVGPWAEDMCRCGFAHDCEFDGWGTNPNQ